MSLQADAVIRATARIQEAHEPPRQKPIIKLDARQQELMMAHVNEANQLASSIRASIDSGRDNPFRPDGEIYKLTNPIVDYYKFGPNQSRAATPSYAELDYFSSKNKRKRRAESKRKAKEDAARRPCWRRWLCCCCCDCLRSSKSPAVGQRDQPQSHHHSPPLPPPSSTDDRFPNEPRQEGDTVRIIEAGERVAAEPAGTDLRQAPPPLSNGNKLKTANEPNKTRNKTKPSKTKKVSVLDEGRDQPNRAESLAAADSEGGRGKRSHHDQSAELETTKVKTVKTSRCVIS